MKIERYSASFGGLGKGSASNAAVVEKTETYSRLVESAAEIQNLQPPGWRNTGGGRAESRGKIGGRWQTVSGGRCLRKVSYPHVVGSSQ